MEKLECPSEMGAQLALEDFIESTTPKKKKKYKAEEENLNKTFNYCTEQKIKRKVGRAYSNMYMLSLVQEKLNFIDDYEDLKSLLLKTPKNIVIQLLGETRFYKYYPKDLYLSDIEYNELTKDKI